MTCIVTRIQHLLGKRWAIFILEELFHKETVSFNQLANKLKLITHKILSERLHEMEENGLICRKVLEEKSPKIEYALTEKGRELVQVFERMKGWAVKYNLTTEKCLETNCTECDEAGLIVNYHP